MRKEKLKSNIWKLYVIKAVGSFMLIMPVITLFFQENGLTMHDIFVLQALFSMSVIALEIPSGYFSDIVGRKKSLVIGYLFVIVGYFSYSLAYGFWEFVGAEMLLGFGFSFVSGTDSALIYDSLLEINEEGSYTRIEGRRFSMGMVSESVASILGGLMALLSLRFPLYCETAALAAAFPVVLSITEPNVCSVKSRKNALDGIWDIIKDLSSKDNKLKWVIGYSSVVAASTLTMVWMIQPYLKEVKIPIGFFGIIWSGLMLLSAFVSWHAERINNFFGIKRVLGSMIVLVSLGYFLLGYTWSIWGSFFITAFYLVRGIHDPVIRAHINGRISSDVRATVLSIKNLFSRVIFSVVGPIVGWVSDIFSLETAVFFAGGIFALFGISILIVVYKSKSI